MTEDLHPGPLAGLRVLDMATIVSAPLSATLLADYGADVVKLELPGVGDSIRNYPPIKEGKSLWWKVTNRNKRNITLDVRRPEGLALFKKLLPRFDVLVENFRPGTLDRWGLSKEVLWELQPRLVILRTTSFGQTGPYRNRPGFTRVFEAMSGATYITGEPDGKPMHMGFHIADAVGGLFGALGIMSALWKRARDPNAPGEEIDLSLTESMMRLVEYLPIEYDQLGRVRERTGNANGYSAPTNVYRTRDQRWVSLSGGNNAVFENNCRAIGREDLLADPRFKSNPGRVEHERELNQIFEDWCAAHDVADVLARFEAAEGTIAPVYAVDQIFADPHFQAREAITRVPDGDFGEVRMQNVVPRFTRDPGTVRSTGGELGADNAQVFGEWLGLSEDERRRLQADGTI
ncbi:MAG: CoA transferase [Burkholderiaceae bacterium]|nr:CoA transferase [Burkholderiaceae bacterium]